MALPMLLLPLLAGQAFAVETGLRFDPVWLLSAVVFAALFQVHLLYTNDHSDEATDRLNTQGWLSGGSRVLPEGRLQSADLLKGARIALLGLLAWTVFLVVVVDRPWMALATPLALFLGWAYHRPPLHWSYRGHGEILQGVGCGVVLPLVGFYLQQGNLQGFPWPSLVPLYLLFHAANIVTALPDYRSDRASNKRTYPVRHGERAARNAVMGLLVLACISLLATFDTTSWTRGLLIVVPAALLLIGLLVSGVHRNAGVDDVSACRVFVSGISISQAWLLCAWTAVLWTGNGQ